MPCSQRLRMAALAVLLAAMCVCSSLSTARADAAITLHYHFIPGETLTYSMTTVETSRVTIAGQPADYYHARTSFQSHYIVHSVDSAGNATLSAVYEPGHSVRVRNGKTTHVTVSPDQLGTPSDACIQEADGTQYCVYRGGYGMGDFGQVAQGPVAVGATWTTTLDNVLGTGVPLQIPVRNVLSTVKSGAYGRVATIRSSETTSGDSTYDDAGKHYVTRVRGTQTGTWQCGVESGIYLGQQVTETTENTGTVRDKHGTHALHSTTTFSTSMRLLSNAVTTVHPLGRAYATTTVAPAGSIYRITYPSSWKRVSGAPGNFQLTSPNGSGLVLGLTTPRAGDTTNPAYVARFLRSLGTASGGTASAVRTIHGAQFGIIDGVIRMKGLGQEAQVEVRVDSEGGMLHLLIGIVGLGTPGSGMRPNNFAREYEQVQAVLNSATPTGLSA